MTKEELLEVIQFKDLEDRTKIKEYFTSPNDLDLNKLIKNQKNRKTEFCFSVFLLVI